MSFIQVTLLEEKSAVVSGYELRNTANLSDLSICVNGAAGAEVTVRPAEPQSAPVVARTVRALDRGDIDRLLNRVAQQRPDFVLVEGVALLQAMEALHQAFPALPLIVDMHNVESLLERTTDRARLPVALRPLSGWLKRTRHLAEHAADRRAVELASMVWTCSAQDAELLALHFGAQRVAVVANPVPDWCADHAVAQGTGGQARELGEEPVILFVGHLGYAPNRRAVTQLCTGIMPALQRQVPLARLVVAGRNPSRRVIRMVDKSGHRLIANPPDLGPLYAGAIATAIPLAQGGGTRIKVLEALAVGCPIVASAKAVEGLGLREGVDYLGAETGGAFADALARLIGSHRLRADLATSGQAFVAERYAAPARRASIAHALKGLRH